MPHNMHLNSSNKFISTGLKTLTAAVVSTLLMVSNVEAAGLGKLTVLSSLGQPLRAEIELTSVSQDEAGGLVAKLASPETYQNANIDFNPALLSLQFAIDQRGDRRFVRVTSTQPINEPFVDMLMELGGTKSHLVREYTLLLDPAGQRQAQPAQMAAPARAGAAPVARSAPSQGQAAQSPTVAGSTITDATRAAATRAVASGATGAPGGKPAGASNSGNSARAAQAAPAAASSGGDYHVKRGDTLARIASENLPAGISLDQMLVALYRSNEGAFVGKNMNRLRSGQILSIPDAASAGSVGKSEAKSVVLAQSSDFKSYRNKLAGMVESAAPAAAAESRQSSGGKITAKVEEQATPASEARDKLKLSRGAAAAGAADAKATATAATEEKIAREKAAAEAQARVKELEKNVSDLQKTLELKNKNLADLQNQATSVKPAAPAAVTPVVPATPAPVAATPAPATAAPAKVESVDAVPAGGAAIVATGAAAAPATSAATDATAAAATPAAQVPAPTAEAPKPVVKPKVVAPPPPEPGFIASLTENPLLLPVGGVLVALLAGLGLFRYRRNRARQQAFLDSSGAPMTNSSLKGNSLFGSTGGQSVDTKNSIFNSNFVPSVSHLDTNVDPVAEADVYIAYGRDAQAEEILKEALRNQPSRNAIRVKLLEIYANRKDPRSFEILASELYSLTRGEGEDWQQAAALGLNVDPANPLYGGGKLQDQVIAKADAITAPTQPMDGLDFNSLTAPTQPQAVPIPELVHTAPTELLAPLTQNELGKQGNAAAKAQISDMDFDLEELGSTSSANQNTVLLSPVHEAGKSMLDSLDFELDHKAAAPAVAAAPKVVEKVAPAVAAFDALDFPAGGQPSNYEPAHAHIDLPFETKPVVKAPVAPSYAQHAEQMVAPLEFNLSGMNLDLDNAVQAHAPAAASAPVHAAPELAPASASANPEMATKLDLAVAYKEIGDKEGARELLEEVLKGGSAEQVDAAKLLIAKL
ncbi:MAG: FimV/HubP family polar landmark protein [Collimonas sp.]|uniref:FimV/HubP family polar landmark protein n=1 Tax=Collimonas sp. TaxID=1963772 RepID=UPI0032663B63